MFCHKCGNQIPEDSGFCPKCGTKIVRAEAIQQTTETIAPAVEPSQKASAMPLETVARENVPVANTDGFRDFVDNHVRATTKFKSAEDLLKNCKPLTFIWICLGVSFLVGSLMSFPIGGLLFLILGFAAAFIAGGIIRARYSSKTSGTYGGEIDTDELIAQRYTTFLRLR